MMNRENKREILIGGAVLFFAVIACAALILIAGMTDPTPPAVRAGWYLPQKDLMWTVAGSETDQSYQEHLIRTGWREGLVPQFPELSPYCRYENYTREKTGSRYMIAVWYFPDSNQFLESAEKLKGYLNDSGTITMVELDFPPGNEIDQSGRDIPHSQDNSRLPDYLITTGYESPDSTGLFFTAEIPGPGIQAGLMKYTVNNEHYIVYYGTAEPQNLASQVQFLQEMIGETYTYETGIQAAPLFTRT